MKEKIQEFINEGKIIRDVEYHEPANQGIAMIPYISGPKYNVWMNSIKVFAVRNLKSHPLYRNIIDTCERKDNLWGIEAYQNMMGYLNTLLQDDEIEMVPDHPKEIIKKDDKKIFISHSSKDIEYVEPIIELLRSIGFAGTDKIFCSSVSGYNIPIGHNIYEYLAQQFNKELIVLFVLSDNYYLSAASLNEMGAAWITSKKQIALLTPDFDFNRIKGAIDPLKVGLKINDKEKINELKNYLLNEFKFPDIEENIWERARDRFLSDISIVDEKYSFRHNKQNVELETIVDDGSNNLICVFRMINNSLTPVVCAKLNLNLTDISGKNASMLLEYLDLKKYKIYGHEQKRIVIKLSKDRVKQDDQFDFNEYDTWQIATKWTTYVD